MKDEPVMVRIIDLKGRLITAKLALPEGNKIVVGAVLVNRIYQVEVIQGNNRMVIKLIKME